jgi:hypothetical protein
VTIEIERIYKNTEKEMKPIVGINTFYGMFSIIVGEC